jgi:hypothetical protein
MTLLDRRRIVRLVLAVAVVLPLGCGSGSDKGLVPLSGSVFVQGRPAAGATVVFHPLAVLTASPPTTRDANVAPVPFPTAVVAEDGSFKLTTFSAGDGAAPGQYRVSVIWTDSYRDDNGDWVEGPDKLGGRYAYPMMSGMSVTVEQGENQLPKFDLF